MDYQIWGGCTRCFYEGRPADERETLLATVPDHDTTFELGGIEFTVKAWDRLRNDYDRRFKAHCPRCDGITNHSSRGSRRVKKELLA